ncbi:hypothetical protein QJS10_CPB19g00613 [Acorus calamus]|uniref:Uncharacterized protein n=1 Tax=Acorus calamus TaxID=4465 RepID=A0AAV9CJT0_ACOCL|nr:hypothetical protein QJS10_CPB19g00613 [Acorus calamus]
MKVTGLGDVGFRELVTLWASNSGITDEGVAMAVQGCGGRLQVVNLEYTKVREYGVIVMVTGCPRLKEIQVCGEKLKRVLECEGSDPTFPRIGLEDQKIDKNLRPASLFIAH